MKKLLIIAGSMLLALSAFGQAASVPKVYLKSSQQLGPFRNGYFLKSFTNNGGNDVGDLYPQVKEATTKEGPNEKIMWYDQSFYFSANSESEAKVIMTGTYKIQSETLLETKVYDKVLPFSMTYPKHVATTEVVRTFEYADGTPAYCDTIFKEYVSREIPGKKFKSLEELEGEALALTIKSFNRPGLNLERKTVKVIFPKVKIKDKALKAEYANVESLLRHDKVAEAGAICKKVYEASPKSPEASACLGLCYEIIGNYPKAIEYTKPLADFHIKSRMRKNKALLDFATKVGYEPVFKDF